MAASAWRSQDAERCAMSRVGDAIDGEHRHRWAGQPRVLARASAAPAAHQWPRRARNLPRPDETYGSPVAPTATRMSILVFIMFGIVAGSIGRAITLGKLDMGIVMAGHLVLALHTAGIIGSVLGALAVLAIMGFVRRHRATASTFRIARCAAASTSPTQTPPRLRRSHSSWGLSHSSCSV